MREYGSRIRRRAIETLQTLGALLLVFALFEAGLRVAYAVRSTWLDRVTLPYVLGHKYGPVPPWIDGIRILEDHPTLLWRGRPNIEQTYLDVFSPVEVEADRTRLLRQFIPRVPASIDGNPTWTVALNSRGFRGPELPTSKPPRTFRVVCLGDSWTFGVGVELEDTFSSRFEGLLRAGMPGRPVEVLNLGVMGYTSLQGLRLLRAEALDLRPDLVVLGFAMNDSSVPGYRDKDVVPPEGGKSLSSLALDALEKVEFYKLLRYAVAIARHEPEGLGERLAAAQRRADSKTAQADYVEWEPWTRVSPVDYELNLREMIEIVRESGARVLLVYNEFSDESPYRDALIRISADLGAPLVDTSELLGAERQRIEAVRARGLAPAGEGPGGHEGKVEVLFRAVSAEVPLHIVASHPALGAGEPNRVAMRDDGTAGDERAADGVWTYRAVLEPGLRLAYLYTGDGTPGQWEALDVPAFRWLDIPAGAAGTRLVRPVETFGAIELKADSWHTNARGNALIAAELARLASAHRDGATAGGGPTHPPGESHRMGEP